MFGCIAAGRLVQTNLQQVDVNKYIFELSDAQNINHLVVFLLGTIPFEPGFGATVHLLWPNKEWQLLGGLCNEKPSAIFRLKSTETFISGPTTATLGISIEPLTVIQQELSNLPSTTALVKSSPNIHHVGQVATRVLENLYNYVTSFTVQTIPIGAIPLGQLTEHGYLPLKTFQLWYENLSRKLTTNPNYLDENKSV